MMNSLYAVFRKYCREHGEELILGAFDQFVFIYFIILLINCEKQSVLYLCSYFLASVSTFVLRNTQENTFWDVSSVKMGKWYHFNQILQDPDL